MRITTHSTAHANRPGRHSMICWRHLVAIAMLFVLIHSPSASAQLDTLNVSVKADRTSASVLEGYFTVAGTPLCIFAKPSGAVSSVTFFLDGVFQRIEKGAPYDLAGTERSGSCKLLDTKNLALGSHVVAAQVQLRDGTLREVAAQFDIVSGLLLSRNDDRSNAQPLDGATVVGDEAICIFTGFDSNIKSVDFFLDGVLKRRETVAPFDLSGSHSVERCNLLDTNTLSVGRHTVSAAITFRDASLGRWETDFYRTPDVLASRSRNRANAAPLDGAMIETGAKLCIFSASNPGVKQVSFSVDGSLVRIERAAPFDLAGTAADGRCNLYSTAPLSAGEHTVSAEFALADGSKATRSASFSLGGPSNDDFVNAIELVGTNGTFDGSNVGATREAGEPNHAGVAGGVSVWYRWTAPADGVVVLNEQLFEEALVFGVYTGSAVGALEQITAESCCKSWYASSVPTMARFRVSAGTQYYIAIDSKRYGDDEYYPGRFSVLWRFGELPTNDDFGTATLLSGGSGSATASTQWATWEAGEPWELDYPSAPVEGDQWGPNWYASVWWRWTAPTDQVVGFTMPPLSGWCSHLSIWTGTGIDDLSLVATASSECVYDEPFPATFTAVAGRQYWIRVFGYEPEFGAPEEGGVTVNWSPVTPPVNDNFADATNLSNATSGSVYGSNDWATLEPGEEFPDRSVWWKWTAPSNGTVTFDAKGSDEIGADLGVYIGDRVTALTEVAYGDQWWGVTFDVSAGTVYRLKIGSNLGGGKVQLNWDLQ